MSVQEQTNKLWQQVEETLSAAQEAARNQTPATVRMYCNHVQELCHQIVVLSLQEEKPKE